MIIVQSCFQLRVRFLGLLCFTVFIVLLKIKNWHRSRLHMIEIYFFHTQQHKYDLVKLINPRNLDVNFINTLIHERMKRVSLFESFEGPY